MTQQVDALTVNNSAQFQQNLTPAFQFSTKKLGEFSLSRQEGENFKFHWLVFSKDKLPEQKIDTTVSSFDSEGLWKFSRKFLQTGEKVKI